jgi:hypothetical protein
MSTPTPVQQPRLALNLHLPPDPGDAGKITLEGVDSDGDGVRDDVQRLIFLTYPNSEKTREALLQQARAWQKYLLNAHDREKLKIAAQELEDSAECLAYVRGKNFDDLVQIRKKFRPLILNTLLREEANNAAEKNRSGIAINISSTDDQMKSRCSFNPDEMEN